MMHAVMKIIYILSVKMKAQLPDTADYGRCLVREILRIWQFILITEKRYRNDAYGRDGKTWNTEKVDVFFWKCVKVMTQHEDYMKNEIQTNRYPQKIL